jgi:hypothetical protein
MSYGYRLNVEDVYFRSAAAHFASALASMSPAPDGFGDGTARRTFRGPAGDEGLAACVLAVVSYAIAFEALTNSAWKAVVAPSLPLTSIRDKLLRSLSTSDKAEQVWALTATGEAPWQADIRHLFALRNRFVHYKDDPIYQGFEFAPQITKDFREDVMLRLRDGVVQAARDLGRLASIRVSYLDGDFQLSEELY